jgi:hypothetical protein
MKHVHIMSFAAVAAILGSQTIADAQTGSREKAAAFANGLSAVYDQIEDVIQQAHGSRGNQPGGPYAESGDEFDPPAEQAAVKAAQEVFQARTFANNASLDLDPGQSSNDYSQACLYAYAAAGDLNTSVTEALLPPRGVWAPLGPAVQATYTNLIDVLNQAGC